VTDITEFSSEAKETWKWVNTTKIQTEIIMVPRRCATVQYLQTFSRVKSHSRARATFQNIALARNQKVN